MLIPNEVLRIMECLLRVCSGAFNAVAEQPSAVQHAIYATIAIRLVVAVMQLGWWLGRMVRRLLNWRRQ